MQRISPHIICTQSVELMFHKHKENMFLQNRIAEVVKERVMPALEELFDEKASGAKQIKIDCMDLDLGHLNIRNWEDDFVQQTIRKVRSKLDEIISFTSDKEVYEVTYFDGKPHVETDLIDDSAIQTLLYFIKSGLLPWNTQNTDVHQLLISVVNHAKERTTTDRIKKIVVDGILYSSNSFERFLLQFSNEEIMNLLQVAFGNTGFQLNEIQQAFTSLKLPVARKKMISFLLYLLTLEDDVINSSISRLSEQLLFTSSEKKEILLCLPGVMIQLQKITRPTLLEKQTESDLFIKIFKEVKDLPILEKINSPSTNQPEENVYFLENAGLVILHPFFEALFSSHKYLDESGFVSLDIHRKAVLLSQFLVTGEFDIQEHQLLLNKILCSYPINETIDSFLELSEEEQKDANELLLSVIEHWTALKATSVAGLRSSFLQRQGKLTEREDHWLLQVEQKSYDVLMNYLPWGIGFIKLPWMDKRVIVEWNY